MPRIVEVILAVSLFLILWPVMLVIGLAIRLVLGSPILFRQMRPGLNEKPFEILKFRTMRDLYDADGKLMSDGNRLTAFGRFLRSTSIDELPELWNVLKGDMSLVGPRPLLMEYLPLYSERQRRRHDVRPGVTGWAQVNGRNAISWNEKFNLDVWYVDNRSTMLDFKILWLTAMNVICRKNITAEGEATMPKFNGTQE